MHELRIANGVGENESFERIGDVWIWNIIV